MERLTGYNYIAGVKTGDLLAGVDPLKAYDRLAAYEATGLMPGEVAVLKRIGGWISVKDRLPEEAVGQILVADGNRVYLITSDWLHKSPDGKIKVPEDCGSGAEILFWRPLP